MATRRSGSSRKRANSAPMIRLVAASIALALGRSSVTSRTAPRRATLTCASAIVLLLYQADERVRGDGAAARRADDERIDVELDQAIGVRHRERLHGEDGLDGGGEIAPGPVAKSGDDPTELERADRPLDGAGRGRHQQN